VSKLKVPLMEFSSALEGVIPSSICTVAPDGTPNITYISIVHRLDDDHVVLSRQFFKKTTDNAEINPAAHVQVTEPASGRQFSLDLEYEHTVTEGTLFEMMRMKLDAVAAFEGLQDVFKLRGVDVCKVLSTEMVPCEFPEGPARRDIAIERVQAVSQQIARANDLDEVIATAQSACEEMLGYPHSFVMLADEAGDRLYTVASAGFPASGTGSEVQIGEGVIGLAAARRQTVRLTNLGRDLHYLQAVRQSQSRASGQLERMIPLPSISSVQSQMVTPMLAHRKLVGVICMQSHEPGAFQAADECVVGILATQVAMTIAALGVIERPAAAPAPLGPAATKTPAGAVQVKYYSEDSTVFLDNEYLIKGVAGGILWRLLRAYVDEQREDFSNKEIRLDQSLDLPDIKDNLEARLILLRKRLEERSDAIRIEKLSRGRFKLAVSKPLQLVPVQAAAPL
jgi:adenylate cyclase